VNLYITLSMTAALLVLSYVLLKSVGFYGPAIAVVSAQYFGVIIYFSVVLRLTRTTLVRLVPVPDLLRVVAASLIGLLAAHMTHDLTSSGLIDFVLAGSIFSATFLFVGALIGVFTSEDYRLAKRWIGKVLPFGGG
jgi:hypothetical protein